MHNLYCNIYKFYPTNSKVIDFVWNVSKENSIILLPSLSQTFSNLYFFLLWEINIGLIQGANLYCVTDFVCIMCTEVNWVHKIFSND